MGIPQALREVGARTETAARWTRWPLERCPPGSQWGAVDLAYGRSLSGTSRTISLDRHRYSNRRVLKIERPNQPPTHRAARSDRHFFWAERNGPLSLA